MNTPNFYSILPATVRYCKTIEPNAKILYSEITALSNKEGYCWATNQYFADLYDVSIRTVQEWLQSLKEHNFIFVDIERDGIQCTRKIWISSEVKEMFTQREKSHPPLRKISPPPAENLTHNITPNNKSKKEEREGASPQPPPLPFFSFEKVKMSQEKHQKLLEDFGEAKTNEMIERLNEYAEINPKRFKQYSCHATVIRKWIRQDKEANSSKSKPQTNQEWARIVIQRFSNMNQIHLGNEGLSFSLGQSYVLIKFTENGFRDQVMNRLRKMCLPVDGL